MDLVNKSKYNIILGSGSSRRKELLGMTGINFSVMSIPVDESFPDSLQGTEISEYIVKNKSDAFNNLIKEIRCPKCTSGSLSSSNAPISEDLKLNIVEMIKDGKSDSDIKQYVSDRFGKESLYDPEFTQQTYILWFGPLIFIVIAFIIFFFRKKT